MQNNFKYVFTGVDDNDTVVYFTNVKRAMAEEHMGFGTTPFKDEAEVQDYPNGVMMGDVLNRLHNEHWGLRNIGIAIVDEEKKKGVQVVFTALDGDVPVVFYDEGYDGKLDLLVSDEPLVADVVRIESAEDLQNWYDEIMRKWPQFRNVSAVRSSTFFDAIKKQDEKDDLLEKCVITASDVKEAMDEYANGGVDEADMMVRIDALTNQLKSFVSRLAKKCKIRDT